MSTVPDPTDAKADGNFTNHRAGYGQLGQIAQRARKGWTLAAGEGLVLVQRLEETNNDLGKALDQLEAQEQEIDRLREELAQQSITLSAEHQRAERILAALREPSEAVVRRMTQRTIEGLHHVDLDVVLDAIRVALPAAVEAAERAVFQPDGPVPVGSGDPHP